MSIFLYTASVRYAIMSQGKFYDENADDDTVHSKHCSEKVSSRHLPHAHISLECKNNLLTHVRALDLFGNIFFLGKPRKHNIS